MEEIGERAYGVQTLDVFDMSFGCEAKFLGKLR
jgi:hypothetical protein